MSKLFKVVKTKEGVDLLRAFTDQELKEAGEYPPIETYYLKDGDVIGLMDDLTIKRVEVKEENVKD